MKTTITMVSAMKRIRSPLTPVLKFDTDGDTQPDVLDCPPGQTSWLTEDMDDDGDGVPDVLEAWKPTTTTSTSTHSWWSSHSW